MTIICKKCGEKGLNGGKGFCFDCYNRIQNIKYYEKGGLERGRKYRKEHPEKINKWAKKHYEKNKEKKKINARDYPRCIKEIKKVECEKCKSKENLEYHHVTYDKKKNIIIVLCRKCHKFLHRK